jgi:hypothetical protein
MTNVCGLALALLLMVTVPVVLLSAFPTRIKVQPVPGASTPSQLPSLVKLVEGVIEEIVKGTLLTLRSARIGLTRGDRLNWGTLAGDIFAANTVK